LTTILNVVPREKFPECPKCGFKMNWDDWGYSMVWNCLSGHYSRPATYEEILAEWGDVVVKL
jgi:hypothetical protein